MAVRSLLESAQPKRRHARHADRQRLPLLTQTYPQDKATTRVSIQSSTGRTTPDASTNDSLRPLVDGDIYIDHDASFMNTRHIDTPRVNYRTTPTTRQGKLCEQHSKHVRALLLCAPPASVLELLQRAGAEQNKKCRQQQCFSATPRYNTRHQIVHASKM